MLGKVIEMVVPYKKYLWIGFALAVVLAVAGGVYLVRDWKKSIQDESFMKGQVDEHVRQEKLAREIEKALSSQLDKIDERAAHDVAAQTEKEIVYVDRITKEIATGAQYSECRISDSMLEDRNAIRRSLDAPADSEAGTDAGEEGTSPS